MGRQAGKHQHTHTLFAYYYTRIHVWYTHGHMHTDVCSHDRLPSSTFTCGPSGIGSVCTTQQDGNARRGSRLHPSFPPCSARRPTISPQQGSAPRSGRASAPRPERSPCGSPHTHLIVVLQLHPVPLAITDPSRHERGHGGGRLPWGKDPGELGHQGRAGNEDRALSVELCPGLAGRVCDSGARAERHRDSGRRGRMWGRGITCREGELDLLLDHLEGHEVMLLIEAPIVEQQPVTLLGGKPEWEWGGGREWGTHPDAGTPAT